MLTGWGRSNRSAATLVALQDEAAVAKILAGSDHDATSGGLVPHGLGRSYSDAAQCAGGLVVDCTGLDWIGPTGAEGTVEVGVGATLGKVNRAALPLGWFVPVTPGIEHVTIGGTVAADVHGKNHH